MGGSHHKSSLFALSIAIALTAASRRVCGRENFDAAKPGTLSGLDMRRDWKGFAAMESR